MLNALEPACVDALTAAPRVPMEEYDAAGTVTRRWLAPMEREQARLWCGLDCPPALPPLSATEAEAFGANLRRAPGPNAWDYAALHSTGYGSLRSNVHEQGRIGDQWRNWSPRGVVCAEARIQAGEPVNDAMTECRREICDEGLKVVGRVRPGRRWWLLALAGAAGVYLLARDSAQTGA